MAALINSMHTQPASYRSGGGQGGNLLVLGTDRSRVVFLAAITPVAKILTHLKSVKHLLGSFLCKFCTYNDSGLSGHAAVSLANSNKQRYLSALSKD